mmetsp:Transcript_19706/g.17417  ORF Transcript_19706/g.17417 Transcript_19706/m.17417 type:complete len:93 (-) Transcript_19706:26-304(-)
MALFNPSLRENKQRSVAMKELLKKKRFNIFPISDLNYYNNETFIRKKKYGFKDLNIPDQKNEETKMSKIDGAGDMKPSTLFNFTFEDLPLNK